MMNKLHQLRHAPSGTRLRSIKNYKHFNKASAGVGVVLFAIVGTILIFRSHAATPFASIEPEAGTRTANATIVSDTTASGGSAVKFGGGLVQPANWFVSVGGTGDCSQANPCGSINAAYQKANPGNVIELAGGTYLVQEVNYRSAADSWTTNVVVRSAAGATVVLNGGLGSYSSHISYQDMKINVGVTFRPQANYNRFDRMTVTELVLINGNHITLSHSRFGPVTGRQAIIMGPESGGQPVPDGITIEDSEVGPTYSVATSHTDGIQAYGTSNLIIRRNIIHSGNSANVRLNQEYGANTNILVENNVIDRCSDPSCQPIYAVVGNGTNVRFLNNTIAGAIEPDTAIYIGNIIGWVSCWSGRSLTHNLIGTIGNNTAASCDPSNVVGTPTFAADGYHLAPGSAGINFGVIGGSVTDYDGQARDSMPDAGADEYKS